MGVPLLNNPIEIASAYFYYLCSNHALVSWNKRIALATSLVGQSANGELQKRGTQYRRVEISPPRITAITLTRS